MRSASLNVIGILNASVQLSLRAGAPWVGVLWITSLPLRFAQLYFSTQLVLLQEPQFYLHYLWKLATAVFASFLISLYGRAVYVRACYMAQNSGRDSKLEPLRVPLGDLIPYIYTALLNELFFYATLFTFFMWPIFVVYGGLAAATSYGIGGPKLLNAPLGALKPCASIASMRTLVAVSAVFLFGLILATINIFVAAEIILWLFGPLLGSAFPRWEYIFQPAAFPLFPKQPLTHSLIGIAATMAIEPFWLAANVDFVQKSRARLSGEDLRFWFQEIKNEATQ